MADHANSTPAPDPIAAIREGLERHFAERGIVVDLDAVLPPLPKQAPPAAIGPRISDIEIARAYFGLESAISDLRRMSALMDVVAEDTVLRIESSISERIHAQFGFDGYHIHILTKDQNDGLNYAISHLNDLIRKLHKTYYAGYEKQAAS